MPELPDTECLKRQIDAKALHQPIAHTRLNATQLVFSITPGILRHQRTVHSTEYSATACLLLSDLSAETRLTVMPRVFHLSTEFVRTPMT